MNNLDSKQDAHGSHRLTRYSSRVTALLVLATAVWGLARCGGSTPEAETPASTQPAAPAEAPAPEAPARAQAPDATEPAAAEEQDQLDFDESGAESLPAPAAPAFDDDKPAPEAPRKERAKSDDSADVGLARGYSLPKALAAIAHFDAQLSLAIEASSPDCGEAEGFRRTVCQLAERICVLESDLPSSGAERHCGDSRARCSAATSRYRQSCPR